MITEEQVHEKIERKLRSIGWEKLSEEFFREHQLIENYIIEELFLQQVEKLNREILDKFSLEERNKVLQKVKSVILNENNPVKVLEYLKGGINVQSSRKKTFRLKLIDHENPANNLYNYGHETLFKGNPMGSKPDFTLFINGIPIVIIEAKREFADYDTCLEAVKDIKEYEKRSPKLFNFVQFGIAYGDEKRYMATLPNSEKREVKKKIEIWKNQEKIEDIFHLLEPFRVTEIVGDFIYFMKDRQGNLFKIVPRYIQYNAVKRALQRIESYLNENGEKSKGLIWHWQGSGKSYEIFYLAEIFIKRFKERYPHVFIVVDRNDLEKQMDEELFLAVQGAESSSLYRKVESINRLKEILRNIKEQEKNPNLTFRGIYLVMAHKFRKEVYEELFEEIGSIEKKEVLILRDEAHRTEYGTLGAVRNAVFKNALRFGFTGTPVYRGERNTFREFAYPEKGEFYLDKFFIEDSLKDRFTVPMVWRPVILKNIYFQLSEEEIKKEIAKFGIYGEEVKPSEVREKITPADILSSENRIKEACRYIAENIEEDTEAFRFKAFVVANCRKACVLYKKYLDEFLSERFGEEARKWSEIVMTYFPGNEKEKVVEDYRISLEKRYGKDWQKINDRLKNVFKEEGKEPRILIVTDMLLTGYDAPILKVMYLDKLMYDHKLLQTCARTNRPFAGKRAGLIVDMTGVLIKSYRDAISRYNLFEDEEVKKDLERNLFKDVEELWESFLLKYDESKRLFEEITGINWDKFSELLSSGSMEREEFNRIISSISLNSNVENFLRLSKDAIELFKAVGSYSEKLRYIENVEWLKIILYSVRKKQRPKRTGIPWNEIKREILSKLSFDPFEEKKEVVFDEKELDKLKTKKSIHVIVADLLFHLIEETEEGKSPIHREIYKRLIELKEKFINKQIQVEEFLEELNRYRKEVNRYKKETSELSTAGKIAYNLKYFLKDYEVSFGETIKVLNNLERKRRWKLLPSDWDEIRFALLVDLRKAFKDVSQREKVAGQLVEEVIKPMVERS